MATIGARRAIELLFAPASPDAKSGQIALTCLRLLVGLIWLRNVVWKVPPDFGEGKRDGLYFWTRLAIDHPVWKPFSWMVEHVVLPNFVLFGWATLVIESALAVLLLTGTAVRLAALLGIGQSIAIGLSVAEAPHEWPWAYAMMIGIHAVLLFTPCARYAAVDAVLSRPVEAGSRSRARRLLAGWAIVLGLIGLVGVWNNLRTDKRATVGLPELEFSLGEYNLRGAMVLVGIAVVLLVGAAVGRRVVAWAAAAVALAAAAFIYVQYGRTGVWLGGTTTTAAVFLCAAVVGLATGIKAGQRTAAPAPPSGNRPADAAEGS